MDLGFDDATAVVVGGGSGMGRAAANCPADDGARVAVIGRTRSVLESTAEDLAAVQSVIVPAYTAAKAMVTSISKNLSLRLAKDEILVNVVSPGSIASEALRWLGPFWASRRNSYMTGANINVDGGSDFT